MAKESTMRAIRQASDEGRNFVFGVCITLNLKEIKFDELVVTGECYWCQEISADRASIV